MAAALNQGTVDCGNGTEPGHVRYAQQGSQGTAGGGSEAGWGRPGLTGSSAGAVKGPTVTVALQGAAKERLCRARLVAQVEGARSGSSGGREKAFGILIKTEPSPPPPPFV